MKIAVNFFNKKNKGITFLNEIIKKTFLNVKSIIYISIGVVALTFVAKYINISPQILNFATNLRQADEKQLSLADVLNNNSIFNASNYIINKDITDNDKIVQATNENQNIYDILDSAANEKKDTQVLAQNPGVNITAENKSLQRVSIGDTRILNYSSKRDIDFNAIMNDKVNLAKKNDKVLLYTTHTSESYTNSEKYKFEYSGTMRSQDANYNMLAISKTFGENLREKGIENILNTTPHDYGAYTSAYAKSKITVQDALKNMGGAGISIDVHRDAVADLTYRPVTQIKGVQVAQVMFVMGVGTSSVKNENWEDNLRLALQIQRLADEIYPGLFKPMMIRDSVYNQNLNKYSFLIEVGATGNTIEEAKLATRCVSNLLNIIYRD